MLDALTRTWASAVASAAGIDMALLPRLTTGVGEVVGRTDERARELLGLPGGIPIVLAPVDAGAATLGITGLRPGQDHASLGTSGWGASVRPPRRHPTPAGASHRLALAGGAELPTSAGRAPGAAAAPPRPPPPPSGPPASAPARTRRRWEPAAGSRARGRLGSIRRPVGPPTGSRSPAAPSCTPRRSSPPERPPPGRGRPTSQERTRRT